MKATSAGHPPPQELDCVWVDHGQPPVPADPTPCCLWPRLRLGEETQAHRPSLGSQLWAEVQPDPALQPPGPEPSTPRPPPQNLPDPFTPPHRLPCGGWAVLGGNGASSVCRDPRWGRVAGAKPAGEEAAGSVHRPGSASDVGSKMPMGLAGRGLALPTWSRPQGPWEDRSSKPFIPRDQKPPLGDACLLPKRFQAASWGHTPAYTCG